MFDDLPALSAPSSLEFHDELDWYLSTDPEQVSNVIGWWYEYRGAYPCLHRMALDYLTIPGAYISFTVTMANLFLFLIATSVDVKRVFSQGRIVLSHLRSQLFLQSIWALMCVGAWSRMGYVKDSDFKVAAVSPVVYGLGQDQVLNLEPAQPQFTTRTRVTWVGCLSRVGQVTSWVTG